MNFVTVGHISGSHSVDIDFTTRIPWLYIITAIGSKIIYIGETYDQSGLITRLSSHFGSYQQSTLKQKLESITNVSTLYSPYLVICARLPFANDNIDLDASAKQIRLAFENILHSEFAANFIAVNPGWTIISTPQGHGVSDTLEIETICRSIYKCFENSYEFLKGLSKTMPFQVVVLDAEVSEPLPTKKELGHLIEEIEVVFYEWVIEILKQHHGESWWYEGIPEETRKSCVSKKEEEKSNLPPEAYLTFIELQKIVMKKENWSFFQEVFQKISGQQAKEKSTQWMITFNESRKAWAHPIKRLHNPVDPDEVI
ncbi:MAG: hypothetical protein ACOYME_00245, partial [Prochlorotrichaceae cyanobacterium]